jgi:hypothetical protein
MTTETTRQKKNSRFLLQLLMLLGAFAFFLACVPMPAFIGGYANAGEECLKLARGNKDIMNGMKTLGFSHVRVNGSTWTRRGKTVVELAFYEEENSTFFPRICTVGDGTVEIVSLFEGNYWKY